MTMRLPWGKRKTGETVRVCRKCGVVQWPPDCHDRMSPYLDVAHYDAEQDILIYGPCRCCGAEQAEEPLDRRAA